MTNELSAEMISELLNDMQRDAHILKEKIGGFRAFDTGLYKCSYKDLEDLSYLTAQIRLKLKVLGAPNMGW